MPARVVLPRDLGHFNKGADEPALDFETQLRRAAAKVLKSDAGVEEDLVEAVACQACEVLDQQESKSEPAKEVLMEALEPYLEGSDFLEALGELCEELIRAADPRHEEQSLNLKAQGKDTKEVSYQRRGDRERARAAEYLREQAVEEERQREVERTREREALEFKRWPSVSAKEVVVPAQEKAASDSEDEEDEVSRAHRESTQRRLRELGQPATFFAETDAERWDRLQRCELNRDQDVLADGSTNVMQILDRRQQREREAAGGIRGTDIVDAEDAEFAALEGTVSRHEPIEQDSASEEEGGPRLAAVLGKDTERDKEAEEAQKKLDEASHEVTSWIRSMLPLLAASVHLSSQQESGGLGRAYGGPLGLSAKKTGYRLQLLTRDHVQGRTAAVGIVYAAMCSVSSVSQE
ncbi:unnamed protein product [Durusdinium trenchii]|uniref:Pre-mRNA processing factor 4 (PRP4)-like domain-containing protein n=1 Tax=Durusdinium trenchii TaxID=1381693 RepID=A0ABP0NP80_9DINO